jgi:hypothetical protein
VRRAKDYVACEKYAMAVEYQITKSSQSGGIKEGCLSKLYVKSSDLRLKEE